jgi:U3 small nucleolar RNA-associated protein 10
MTIMWSTMTIESILQMRQARVSEETIVSRIMPFIAQGLQMRQDLEFQVATYMVLTILASNRTLTDKVMIAAMDSICQGWTDESRRCGIMCLATLAQVREGDNILPDSVVKALLSTEYYPTLAVLIFSDINGIINSLPEKTPCDKFLAQLTQKLLKSSQLENHSEMLTDIVFSDRLSMPNRHAIIQSATIECSKFGLASPSETPVGKWLAYCATEHTDDFKTAVAPILHTFGNKQLHNLQIITQMNLKVHRYILC